MTQLLEAAIARLQQLPASEQDAIAQRILDEMTDEQKWEESFARSQDALSRLANKARTDIKTGRVRRIDMDEL